MFIKELIKNSIMTYIERYLRYFFLGFLDHVYLNQFQYENITFNGITFRSFYKLKCTRFSL